MKNNAYSMEELVPVVAKLAEKYTSKESTSVSYTHAKQLMGAVQYCIREQEENKVQEKNVVHKRSIVSCENKLSAQKAYEQGYQRVLAKTKKAMELYNVLNISFEAFGNKNYIDTFKGGISGFFRFYDARFEPQNSILTFDYPTLVSLDGKCGIDAIYCYLQYIQLEQKFLQKLPYEYCIRVLKNQSYYYEELLINVVSPIIRNLLAYIIVGKSPMADGLTERDYATIRDFVNENDKCVTRNRLEELIKQLIDTQYEGDKELADYLSADLPDFCTALQNAMENNCMERIL